METSQVSPYAFIAVLLVIVVSLGGGGYLLLNTRPDPVQITINPPVPTATPLPTATPAPITVYITGAVNEPQTLAQLPAGSRVEDALAAAGGVTDAADMVRVNLADIVRDGDQVHVPVVDEVVDLDAADVVLPTPIGGELVYINRATSEELQTLPSIGPTTAENIVAYREANGPFESLSDLDDVSGIGPATLERLEPLISFE